MTRDLILALSGGIGGAKLALGLSRVLPPENLLIVANVGDDFEHLGLHVSPDVDTLLYTLAGLDNRTLGWGRADETWNFMDTLRTLGGETWFALGDRDLAIHIERTRRLRAGQTLSEITEHLRLRLGVQPRILPATDDPVRTMLQTDEGWLEFQDYFVRQHCAPVVRTIAYESAATARPQPEILAALQDPRLRAVVICPSNPYLSVDPILAMPAMRNAIAACTAPVIAVSPLIGGRAVKGPTAKLMAELGLPPSTQQIGRHYGALLDIFVIDPVDETETALGMQIIVAPTLMTTIEDREALARVVLGGSVMPGIMAVIPIKQGTLAKQRLATALDGQQRATLVLCMLGDVLAALSPLCSAGLAGVIVVTADPAAASLTRHYAADCIQDGAQDGHIPAIAAGMRAVLARGHAGMLVLPGDIPAATTAELAALLAAHGPAPAFTIAPSHDEMGSNAVLCSPPPLVPACFGANSFRVHLAAARAVGIEPRVIHAPGIALDIDTPADLLALQRMRGPRAPRTRRYLDSLTIAV